MVSFILYVGPRLSLAYKSCQPYWITSLSCKHIAKHWHMLRNNASSLHFCTEFSKYSASLVNFQLSLVLVPSLRHNWNVPLLQNHSTLWRMKEGHCIFNLQVQAVLLSNWHPWSYHILQFRSPLKHLHDSILPKILLSIVLFLLFSKKKLKAMSYK